MFHVMAPEELTFQFGQWSRFECLEQSSLQIDLDPPTVREEYMRSLNEFLNKVRMDCTNMGADYLLLPTDADLGQSLRYYLHRRAARVKH